MKKTTLRMTVISACVGAGLALSACGGAGGPEESGDTGADNAASQEDGADEAGADDAAAEAAVYTEDDLTAAVEAGGFEAQSPDQAGAEELNSAMGELTVEPAECEVFMNAATAAIEDSDVTTVVGTPTGQESTTIGGAVGYPSADAATDMLSSSSGMIDSCGDMTITAQGMEMTSSTTAVDATVDGADQVVATEVDMDVAGQEVSTLSVQAQKGNAIITVTSGTGSGMEGDSVEDLTAIATDMIAALP